MNTRADKCSRCEGNLRMVTPALEVCLDCGKTRRVRFVKGWEARAACKNQKTNIWYPRRGKDPRPAKKICASCPVRRDCLSYALKYRENVGIWGGLTARERRRLIHSPDSRWKMCRWCRQWFVVSGNSIKNKPYCSNRCLTEKKTKELEIMNLEESA